MRHILMYSGGVCSWFTGEQLAQRLGQPPELLFTDTLIEDEDLYRFLIQGASRICGIRTQKAWNQLKPLYQSIPPLEQLEARKLHLKTLARLAMEAILNFHWLQDGRTPWEVFHAVRLIGNTRAAPCSHKLKQDVARTWLEKNCTPQHTRIYLGLHWSEQDRLVKATAAWEPWAVAAPLCEPPYLPAQQMFEELTKAQITLPVLYRLGFTHNNCGGFCVRAGHVQFRQLLKLKPLRYAWHEQQEEAMRAYLGADVSILRDRIGGTTRPLPLRVLREGGRYDSTDTSAGCGCFLD